MAGKGEAKRRGGRGRGGSKSDEGRKSAIRLDDLVDSSSGEESDGAGLRALLGATGSGQRSDLRTIATALLKKPSSKKGAKVTIECQESDLSVIKEAMRGRKKAKQMKKDAEHTQAVVEAVLQQLGAGRSSTPDIPRIPKTTADGDDSLSPAKPADGKYSGEQEDDMPKRKVSRYERMRNRAEAAEALRAETLRHLKSVVATEHGAKYHSDGECGGSSPGRSRKEARARAKAFLRDTESPSQTPIKTPRQPREPEEGVKGGKGRGEEGPRRKRSALELMQDLEAQKDVDETSSFRHKTPKQQADALIASFSGAIQELAAQRDQDELLEHFQKPCPTEAEEVLAFAGRCEQILLKAGKASKKRKGDQLYLTQLLEGVFKDGVIGIRKVRHETDTEIIARATCGLMRAGVNPEDDLVLRAIWNDPTH